MRSLSLLALASLAIPAAAQADGGSRIGDQAQRTEQKRADVPCASRDRDRQPREAVAKVDCKVNLPVPPVVDPTPMFLP